MITRMPSRGEGLACAEYVVGAEDQADAAEGGVGKIDVHVGVGEPTCHLTQRPGLVRDVHDEPLAAAATPMPAAASASRNAPRLSSATSTWTTPLPSPVKAANPSRFTP